MSALKKVLFLLFVTATLGWVSWAQAAPAESLVERLAGLHRVSDVVSAPQGQRSAFVVRAPGEKLPLPTSIWIHESGTPTAKRLTDKKGHASSPRWSPDGTRLAFLESQPKGGKWIRVMDVRTGKVQKEKMAENLKGISGLAWLGDGSALVVLANQKTSHQDKVEEGMVVGSRYYKRKALYLVDPQSRAVKAITTPAWAVGAFAPIPGQAGVVVAATDKFRPEGVIRRLFVIDSHTGVMREFGNIGGAEYDKLRVSPDGRHLAYIGSTDGPTYFDLYVQSLDGGPAVSITGPEAAGIDRQVSDYAWVADSRLMMNVAEGLGNRIYRVHADGTGKTLLRTFDKQSVRGFSASRNGNLTYVLTSDTDPVEVWVDISGERTQTTSLHADFPDLVAGTTLDYVSRDGVRIEAKVFHPAGGQARPWPTVVFIHGGPTARWSHKVDPWIQMLVAKGFAVFAPNIRGSTGYSQAFLKSNRADWGGGDFQDIMAGVDLLVEKGLADPDRLGIAGWSYGGYMSAWAVTQTDRFKAAVAGGAMLDLRVQWGAGRADIVPYDSWYNGVPWEEPGNYTRMSPITYVKSVKTPTLLLVGENDDVDPPVQNWQFYRALRMNGVPAELVVYPREKHGVYERDHAIDVMHRMARWMQRYLLQDPSRDSAF